MDDLLKRLEAQSKRLGVSGVSSGNMKLTRLLERLDKKVTELEKKQGDGDNKAVTQYDDFYEAYIKPFAETCNNLSIGGYSNLGDIGDRTVDTFKNLRKVIVYASTHPKPKNKPLKQIFGSIGEDLKKWDDIRFETKRMAEEYHYTACHEAFKMNNWIFSRDAPFKFVKDCMEQTGFYTNKVLQMYRKKDALHLTWSNQLKDIIKNMMEYVKENHYTGLKWKRK